MAVAVVLGACRGSQQTPAATLPPTAATSAAAPAHTPAPTWPPSPSSSPSPAASATLTGAARLEATRRAATALPRPTSGTAFGRPPGVDTWTAGDKLGVGTAYTYDSAGDGPAPSRVWFTITGGAITDFLYPTVGRAGIRELSLLVSGPEGLRRETDPAQPVSVTVDYLDPRALAYRVITADPGGGWQAAKEVVTDPEADSLITRWVVTSTQSSQSAYAYFVPHLDGSGRGDQVAVRDGAVVAWDEEAAHYAVLLADPPPARASVGYLRTSDGLTDLADGTMDWSFDRLPQPNYGAATLALPVGEPVTLVVGFGASEAEARSTAEATLRRGFDAVAGAYVAGWQRYLEQLKAPAAPDPLYWVSAMILKAHEDKTHRGAGVASLAAPWGQCLVDARPIEQGYRYVWPRDLYHVAMAFVALGDLDSTRDTLVYLDDVLQQEDGAFPQNAFLDGTTRWFSLQMDEVADPILLAWFLGAQDRFETLVRPAADFIAADGPVTRQERWEEIGGYVPHSIAAQVAALVAAAEMAEQAGDSASAARWRATADEWAGQLEARTFTTTGPLGNGDYFLRVAPDGDPNRERTIAIANGGGEHPMKAIVDTSTLELVRLGVRAAGNAAILETIPELDTALREETPNGPGWHRYRFDAYGEVEPGRCTLGKGHLWPLLTGERGHYALAAGQPEQARAMLETMRGFANPGLMLPEQVFAATGEGTGSATPLAWAHAEYILLARSLEEGRVLDLPTVVAERYAAP